MIVLPRMSPGISGPGLPALLRAVLPLLAVAAMLASTDIARAANAPDPSGNGPSAIAGLEYKFPAKVDTLVTNKIATELWAVLWRPQPAKKSMPLVVLVHGNHSTCGRVLASGWRDDNVSSAAAYAQTGSCPSGQVVVPNHRGYDYLARKLASWGFVVLSINLNRGINVLPAEASDPGLILRRARLVLRHLELLGNWNSGAVPPPSGLGFNPRGAFDFSKIALMGHSRGGDAVVAVPGLADTSTWRNRLPSTAAFKAILSLAPTDFQAAKPAPSGTVFSTLLPLCDGDVIDLQGIRFFDRSLRQVTEQGQRLEKSSFHVWGTNHNGYNSEWHSSDADSCVGQGRLFPSLGNSADQQRIAQMWVMGLVRSVLQGKTTLDRLVDPVFGIPGALSRLTKVDRGFVPTISGRRLVHALDTRLPGGCANKVAVTSGVAGSCVSWPEHDTGSLVALARWGSPATTGSASPMLRIRAGASGNLSLTSTTTLDIRFGPDCFRGTFGGTASCTGISPQYPASTPSTFSQGVKVFLEDTSGSFSRSLSLGSYASGRGPVATRNNGVDKFHALLRTARIPLSAFGTGFSKANVRYVWFDFRPSTRGGFVLGELSGQTISVPAVVKPEIGGETGVDRVAVVAPVEADAEGKANALPSNGAPLARSGNAPTEPAETEEAEVAGSSRGDDGDHVAAAEAARALAARDRNRIVSMARVSVPGGAGAEASAMVRIEVESSRPFPVTARGLTLQIGNQTFSAPDPFSDKGTTVAVFEVPVAALGKARRGDGVSVHGWASSPVWRFGAFDPAAIR